MDNFTICPQWNGDHRNFEIVAQKEQGSTAPLVTVAISLYNYKNYIIPCLESVKAQTIATIDLIVVDDCSEDGSLEVVQDWLVENGNRFDNYLFINHRHNGSTPSARNTAFTHARTDYVFVLDADNLIYPRCLVRLVSALRNCDASFAYCYLEKFGTESCLQNTNAWDASTLQDGNGIDAMVLLRKDVWEQVGGYSTNQIMRLGWEDFELWFKIARIKGWGILVPEILARYRVHPNSRSDTTQNPNIDNLLWPYLRSNYPEFWNMNDMNLENNGKSHIGHLEKMIIDKEKQINNLTELIENQEKVIADKEGHINNLSVHARNLEKIVANKEDQEVEHQNIVQSQQLALAEKDQILQVISKSFGWRLVTTYYKFEDKFLPQYTRRRKVYDLIMKNIKEEIWQTAINKRTYKVSSEDYLYHQWILKNEPDSHQLRNMRVEQQSWSHRPKISIIMQVCNPKKHNIYECIKSVLDQIYDNWELCLVAGGSDKKPIRKVIKNFADMDQKMKVVLLSGDLGIVGNFNEALKLATGEYVGLLDHHDTLAPFALYEVVKFLNKNPTIDFLYSDEDKVDRQGKRRYEPHFKPDWSPDTLLSYNYACHFAVVRKTIIDFGIGGFREGYDGAQDYDLILRIVRRTHNIARISKILYHRRVAKKTFASTKRSKVNPYSSAKRAIEDYLRDKELEAKVLDGMFLGSYRVKYKIRPNQTVSIIIPTKDRVSLLKVCISSILTKTEYKHFKILITDNKSVEQQTYDFYDSIKDEDKIKIIHYDKQPFNFTAINNFAVGFTDSEYIVFLNNDTEVINNEWLTAMLEFAQRKDVGAVGAKLYYPNDTIQHAGVIIGIAGVAGHSHRFLSRSNQGYMGTVNTIQNLSGATAACLMVRREVFDEVGGFEEKLTVAYNDVDLCLKIREKGYLIVYTPYAELYHHESMSRGYEDTSERQARFAKEVAYMQSKWQQILKKGDPYYNPNLTLSKEDFSIRIGRE